MDLQADLLRSQKCFPNHHILRSPKLGSFPCSLKIFTNVVLLGVPLFHRKPWVAPFTVRACNMGLNKAPYEEILSLGLVPPHKWVWHGHFYLMCNRKQNKHAKITKRIKGLSLIHGFHICVWYSCNCLFPCNNRTCSI